MLVLAQWPFAYGTMLWWGCAAVVPLLIHFWSRRRYRETSWAAMQFLLAAVKKHGRRIRLEQWLLLLIRMAVLLLLATALAEPLVSARKWPPPGKPRTNTHWILVLDSSYSMEYRPAGTSRFEQAQQAARELVSRAEQGDGFSLLLLADLPEWIIPEPAFDGADVSREISALRVRHGMANLPAVLAEVHSAAEQARRLHPRLTTTRVCFFSDLGKNTWEAVESDACRRLLRGLPANTALHVFDVGQATWSNAAVVRLDVLDPLVTTEREVRVVAEIRRLSLDQPQRVHGTLLVDGQTVREVDLDLTGGTETWSVSQRFSTPGEHVLELRLDDSDPLTIDNRRWRVVTARETVRALCLEGEPGAAHYVALALEPRRTDRPLVRWEVASQAALLERDLRDYDCLFLCNLARFRREEAVALGDYVRGGGGLVVCLGDRVEADNYNEMLGAGAGTDRVLPATLHETLAGGTRTFDPLGYRHPLVQPFSAHERAGLLTVPFWRYVRLEVNETGQGTTALAFDNGAPALLDESIGRGRVFLFASAVTASAGEEPGGEGTAWTEFATWPSFPPLIQRLLALTVQRQDARRQMVVGEPLEGGQSDAADQRALVVTTPNGESESVVWSSESGSGSRWLYPPTYWSGVYRVSRGANEPEQHFAVNVDVREGQLERYDAALLPAQFREAWAGSNGDTANAATASGHNQQSLARPALVLLFGLLLCESYLAWRFGSARS